ncbi:hypothetical protein MACH10_23360 [Thalassospira tepidiphila]|nr:hypothetical protein MACH10_23360 [Thalassospira tepidiphila]
MQWGENIRYIRAQFPWQDKGEVFKVGVDHVMGLIKIDDQHIARDNVLVVAGDAAAFEKKLDQNMIHIVVDDPLSVACKTLGL